MTDEQVSIPDSNPTPPAGPAPHQPFGQPAGGRRWMWIGLVAAVVVVGVVAALLAPKVFGGSKFTATGEFELTDASGTINYDGQHCRGQGGYSDIREGTQVVITDQSGTVIATTKLGTGLPLGGACVFKFSASVPSGKTFYGVAVSHRGTLQYKEADLKSGVRLTLG